MTLIHGSEANEARNQIKKWILEFVHSEAVVERLRAYVQRAAGMADTYDKTVRRYLELAKEDTAYATHTEEPPASGLIWDSCWRFWRPAARWPLDLVECFPFSVRHRIGIASGVERTLTSTEQALCDAVTIAALYDCIIDTPQDPRVNVGIWANGDYESIQNALIQLIEDSPARAESYLKRVLTRARNNPQISGANEVALQSRLEFVTILLGLAAISSLLMLYRHYTVHSQASLLSFLGSARVIFPPLAIIAIPFLFLLITGKPLKEAPHITIRCLRKVLLQHPRRMVFISSVAVLIVVVTVWHLASTPPPFYTNFLVCLFGGASDRYSRARAMVEKIADLNPDAYDGYGRVLDVFSFRSEFDHGGKPPEHEIIRSLCSSLETPYAKSWAEHPLRWHALGEAYSLYTQLSKEAAGGYGATQLTSLNELADKSVFYYDKVWQSASCFATAKLKRRAMLNKGNLFYRLGKCEDALAAWRCANTEPSMSAWGNVLAGLVLIQRYGEAAEEGKKAIAWARQKQRGMEDPSSYSSLYANTAFAEWMLGMLDEALINCQQAVTFQPDVFNKLNLAHALILSGKTQDAQAYLRSFMDPVTPDNQQAILASEKSIPRGYILWLLADPNAATPIQAARLYTILGERHEAREIVAASEQDLGSLVHRAVIHLGQNQGMCSDFLLVPATRNRLDSLGGGN